MRYFFDYCPNPEIVIIHVGKKMFEKRVSTDPLHRTLSCISEGKERGAVEPDPEIITDLMKIEGIKVVGGSPYELHIEKAKIFLWTELKPLILECLKKNLGDPDLEEVRRPSQWASASSGYADDFDEVERN